MSDRDRPGDVLPLLREDRGARAAVLPALLVLCLLYAATDLRPTLLRDGLSATAATAFTGLTIAVTLATARSLFALVYSTYLTQAVPLASRLFIAGLVLPVTTTLYGMARSVLHARPGAGLVLAAAGLGVTLTLVVRARRRGRRSRAYQAVIIGHPEEAEEFIEACRGGLDDASLTDDARSALDLLLASALADRAILVDRYDDLPEAERIVARWTEIGNARGLVGAAMSLAPALVVRTRATGDVDGLEDGLAVVAQTIARVPSMLPVAQRVLLVWRARGLLELRSHAEDAGDTARMLPLLAAAIDDLERALALTAPGSTDRGDLRIELASIIWAHPAGDGLDAAIERCRSAVRSLRLRPSRARDAGCLVLAELLAERALAKPDRARADFAEAVALCELVARRSSHPHHALTRLPVFLEASNADESFVAHAFRRAFDALCGVSFEDAADLAADWAIWAEGCCFTTEAAEAHRCWMRSVVTESQRRRLRGDVQRPQVKAQALAAYAGLWLLAAGRPLDAAITMELACGVTLDERMHRARGEITQRLADANRDDLGERWLEIGERMVPQHAEAGDARRDASATSVVRVGGRSFRGDVSSRDFRPLADYERLVREISRVPGFEDVDAPATYEELREAAAEGPLVYLAATVHGGFAIIVTQSAPQPAVVALPGVAAAAVGARIGFDVDAPYDGSAALDLTLDWLGRFVLKPLAPALAPGAIVTLIPVGALRLLPIHVAGMTRREDGVWRDRTGGLVFRYAPSGRRLAQAQATVRRAGDPRRPIATIDHGCIEDALGALGDEPVWHIGCPLDLDLVDPLASRLHLADGRLSVRAILTRGRSLPRLTVVSAGRTCIGLDEDLNELVELAAALLHEGVAGVVSAPAVVDGEAATLLVLGFLQRFADGASPVRALAEAQAWLASATNRQIAAAVGPLYSFSEQPGGPTRAAWERHRAFSDPQSWAVFSYYGA